MTRQGNPANANVDTDGDGVLRTIDLFQGSGGGTPWVNRDRIPVPQADVQQRLFARLVRQLLDGVMPLPQLWYFPGDEKTMMILTGDAHANPAEWFDTRAGQYQRAQRQDHAVSRRSAATRPTRRRNPGARRATRSAFIRPRIARRVKRHYVCANLAACYNIYETWWNNQGFTSDFSRTVRNHQVAWQGWTDAAEIEVAHDIAMDTNFYHWGEWLQKPDNSWPMGYITGSGQPMKFIKADGTVLPLYQQLTQLVDEQLTSEIASAGWQGLNAAQAIDVSENLIDASLAGDYAAIMTQFHVDYYCNRTQTWAEGDDGLRQRAGRADVECRPVAAVHRNAPRRRVHIDRLAQDERLLSWSMTAASNSNTLSVLVPLSFDGREFHSALVDGALATDTVFTVNGRQHVLIQVSAGDHTFYAGYGGPPYTPTPIHTATSTLPATPRHIPAPTVTTGRTPRIWVPFVASSP